MAKKYSFNREKLKYVCVLMRINSNIMYSLRNLENDDTGERDADDIEQRQHEAETAENQSVVRKVAAVYEFVVVVEHLLTVGNDVLQNSRHTGGSIKCKPHLDYH